VETEDSFFRFRRQCDVGALHSIEVAFKVDFGLVALLFLFGKCVIKRRIRTRNDSGHRAVMSDEVVSFAIGSA
jgi:hypothetical protein